MKLNDLYKCSVCGNVVEITHVGGGELVCCSKPMQALVANTEEASTEKHIPVIEKTEKGYLVKVGSVPHPMEEKHYIEMGSRDIYINTDHITSIEDSGFKECVIKLSNDSTISLRVSAQDFINFLNSRGIRINVIHIK